MTPHDPDPARLRELLDSAVGGLHVRRDLVTPAVDAHHRRRRRLAIAVATTAVVAIASATSLAATVGHRDHGGTLVATGGRTPRPSASSSTNSSPSLGRCGPARPNEQAIGPDGGLPYLSAPPAHLPALRVGRSDALRQVKAVGSPRLRQAPVRLELIRGVGAGRCTPTLGWIAYTSIPGTDVPMGGGPDSTCVEYFWLDATHPGSGSDSVTCTSHPNPQCPTATARPANGFGGGPTLFGDRYSNLPKAQGSWQRLARSPLPSRDQPAVAWTGSELIVWGGEAGPHGDQLLGDGAAYDPSTDRWTMLPRSPLSPRVQASAVWTGTELVIWGGYDDVSGPQHLHVTATGAAYNPATGAWRKLPTAPLTAAANAAMAWTGHEVIILDGHPAVMTDTIRGYRQAAAYDPATNKWRRLPAEPAGTPAAFNVAAAQWLTDRLVVFHSYDVGGAPDAVTVDIYSPATNEWTHQRKCDGAGYVGTVYPDGEQILVPPFGSAGGWMYNPSDNTWRAVAGTPLSAIASATTPDGGLLILTIAQEGRQIQPGDVAIWNQQSGAWSKPPRLPTAPGGSPTMISAGSSVLVWTGDDRTDLYAFKP